LASPTPCLPYSKRRAFTNNRLFCELISSKEDDDTWCSVRNNLSLFENRVSKWRSYIVSKLSIIISCDNIRTTKDEKYKLYVIRVVTIFSMWFLLRVGQEFILCSRHPWLYFIITMYYIHNWYQSSIIYKYEEFSEYLIPLFVFFYLYYEFVFFVIHVDIAGEGESHYQY
jgi:hypothetical protein